MGQLSKFFCLCLFLVLTETLLRLSLLFYLFLDTDKPVLSTGREKRNEENATMCRKNTFYSDVTNYTNISGEHFRLKLTTYYVINLNLQGTFFVSGEPVLYV